MDAVDLSNEIDETLSITCRTFDKPELCRKSLIDFNLRVMTCNIRSLQRNFLDLVTFLQRLECSLDVIILTECWLNEHSVIHQLPGYKSFNTSKIINKSGGVTAYVKDGLLVKVIEPDIDDANCLLIELKNYVTLVGIYRSPSFSSVDRFLDSLDAILIDKKSDPVVIVTGDINIDLLDKAPNATHAAYQCLLAEHGLLPAITEPTRGHACLDHAFIKTKSTSTLGVVCRSSITDHNIVLLGSNSQKAQASTKNRSRLRTDYSKVIEEIELQDWAQVISKTDVDEAVSEFHKLTSDIIQKHTRISKISRKKIYLKPWITPGLIRCINHRDSLHLQVKLQPDNEQLKLTYSRYRNFCGEILRKRKQDYERNELESNRKNPRALWKTIKDICQIPARNNNSNTELLKSADDHQMSIDSCNKHFVSVGSKLAENILKRLAKTEDDLCRTPSSQNQPMDSLFLYPADEKEISEIILSLKNDSAPGADGIRPFFLKQIRKYILKPLTHICNLSMVSGTFPSSWKTALVVPVHKSGPKDTPDNYRPISLLPIPSKILEKIVNKRLVKFIEEHHLISDRQFGFRHGKSNEQATELLTDIVSSTLDKGFRSVGVFLDLAKAFDTVSIPILLNKMQCFGVRGSSLAWFASYLTGRQQIVRIGEGSLSQSLPINFGVPQGSVLGPTLFTIYINDLLKLEIPRSDVICYADDTAIIFHGANWKDAIRATEIGMSIVCHWLDNNLLTLNTSKTNFIMFHITRASAPMSQLIKIHCSDCPALLTPSVSCNCSTINRIGTTKYLGIIIDENLSFKQQISALSKKTRKYIYLMKLLRGSAPPDICKKVYISLCQGLLQYCARVWGCASKSCMLELERAQRAILKVLLGKPRRYPTTQLYKEAAVLSVRQLYVLGAFMNTYKTKSAQTRRSRGNTYRIQTPIVKTAFGRRFARFLHIQIFNKISEIIRIPDILYDAKKTLGLWVQKLTYTDTEKLITPLG